MKKYNTTIISIIFILASAVWLAGCNQETSDEVEPEREIPVRVQTIVFGSLSDSNLLAGTVVPDDQVDVSAKSTAEIKDIYVKKGDHVEQGDVLAVLDDFVEQNALKQQQIGLKQAQSTLQSALNGKATAEMNVEQARAALKQAEASLAEAKKSKNDSIENIEFQIRNAETALKQTEQHYQRVKQLYEEGLTSKQNLEDAEVALENAKNALEQAKLNKDQASSEIGLQSLESAVEQARIGVRIAESSVRDAEIAVQQAQAQVDQAQLAVEAAEENLNYKTIVAPISGEILDVMAEIGEIASPQAPFATIVAVDRVKVSVNVLPTLLPSLQVGDMIDIEVEGVDEVLEGTISYVSPLSSGSGLFTVEADVNDPEGRVRPGMIASFVLDEVLVADTILVPTEAIVQKEGLDIVFIVENGVAVLKEVTVERFGTDWTAVTGDLKENDKVVTSGQTLLEDGDKVTVMEEE